MITNINDLQTTNNICYYNYRKNILINMCLINWYLRTNIMILRLQYILMKRKKGNGVLSKKVNFVECEDIVLYWYNFDWKKNVILAQLFLTVI